MASTSLFFMGLLAVIFLSGSQAQNLQYSSFSKIPQSVLSKLSSDQIANIKKSLNGSGGAPAGDANSGGDDNEYDDSISALPPDQPSSPSSGGAKNGGGDDNNSGTPSFKVGNEGPSAHAGQTLQFSSYSQIPKSILDNMSSQQREEIRKALTPEMVTKTTNSPQPTQSNQSPDGDDGSIPTFRLGKPGGVAGKPMQFSKYSDIPQSLLDQLSSAEKERIKDLLTPKMTTRIIPGNVKISTETLKFTSYSQIPQSILDRLTSTEKNNIKNTLSQSKPNTPVSVPINQDKKTNDLLNTIKNYLAAGGYLTGIPPVDLLLLRIYLNEGPKKFC